MLTGIPLLHYFKCGNEYSGAHFGMRYHFKPAKRKTAKEDGSDEEKQVLAGVIWPEPWAEEKTDPALMLYHDFDFSDDGRMKAEQWLKDTFSAEKDKWKNCPSILDSEPWHPADSTEKAADAEKKG